jgi:hypothetical protein
MNEATKKQSDPIEDGFIQKPTEAKQGEAWAYNPHFPLGSVYATPEAVRLLGPNMVDLLISHADLEQGGTATTTTA